MKAFKKTVTKAVKILFFTLLTLFLLTTVFCLILSATIDYSVDEELFNAAKNTSVTHFYANGSEDGGYIPVEIEATAFGAAKKVWYSNGEISDHLKNGFIAAEDREFYSHGGVNFRRTAGAFLNYVFGSKSRYGASTITQQVVKNISGDNEVSARRKLLEIFRALNMEKRHSKAEILELYMNIVPMSENIAGVGYASECYFGCEPSELTLAQAATIVGITNSPTRYDPRIHPEACIQRRNTVLVSMLEMDLITAEEYAAASAEELCLEKKSDSGYSSWFIETAVNDVVKDLSAKYGISRAAARLRLIRGGYNIYTTEDPRVQAVLEEILTDAGNLPKEVGSGLNFAMCVCDSKSGDLVGIVGAAGAKRGNRLLDLAEMPHPPGSCLKPLALYAPLLNEKRINWASVFDDVPVEFSKNGDSYTEFPKNSPEVYSGLITVKDAVRLSKNTVAVRLYKMLGARKIFNSLKNDFGFETLTERAQGSLGAVSDLAVSPLALGQLSYGVSLRALTEAYTVFPSEGIYNGGRSYLYVTDKNGATVLKSRTEPKRVFTVSCARIMNQLLMNVVADGTARTVTLKDTVDTAGKTGTTANSRDRLFVGYTPYYTAGIWCGYTNSSASVGAIAPSHLEIWDKVMTGIHRGLDAEEHFSTSGLVLRDYCKDSGDLPGSACSLDMRGGRTERGWFTPDNMPHEYCTRHILCKYDLNEGRAVYDEREGDNIVIVSLLNIPERDLPKNINVADDEYIYRRPAGDNPFRGIDRGYLPNALIPKSENGEEDVPREGDIRRIRRARK